MVTAIWQAGPLAHVPSTVLEDDDGEDSKMSVNMSRSPGTHVRRSEVEEEEVSESLLGRLPPKSQRRRDETVLKLNSFAEWEPHRFVLSDEKVFLSHVGRDTITDLIPLVTAL
jgi:hypothetical protein